MLALDLVDIASISKSAVSHSKYLIERWHRSRGHDQSNADDRVAVESIGIGHHYDARYGQDSSYYLYREREREREQQWVKDGQHAAHSLVKKAPYPLTAAEGHSRPTWPQLCHSVQK